MIFYKNGSKPIIERRPNSYEKKRKRKKDLEVSLNSIYFSNFSAVVVLLNLVTLNIGGQLWTTQKQKQSESLDR